MGPRPNGRGKLPLIGLPSDGPPERQWGRGQTAAERREPWNCAYCRSSVNGAAAKRPRKATRPARRFSRSSGVNGAAAKRPRKEDAGAVVAPAKVVRQWGRGQTAAESAEMTPNRVGGAASMGPRPNGRGKRGAGAARPERKHASMGPRPNGRGKHQPLCGAGALNQASMGPRPNGRGKKIALSDLVFVVERQWGRGQTAAERTSRCAQE